jgi:hypothetical protein
MRFQRGLVAVLLAACAAAAQAQAGQGWIVEVTWRYEAQAARTLRGGTTGPGGADTRVSAASEAKIVAEARGTMEFSGKLRGAAAVNMPDSRNEQRYDSWRFRGGKPAFASVETAVQFDEAARLNRADGEGASAINAERKGLVGRVQYQRERIEVKASGDDAGWFGDHADLQIDRVANKLMIVNRIDLQLNRKAVRPIRSVVRRMDKPAAAGEWDSSGPDDEGWRSLPHVFPRGVIEFDIPAGAEQFTLTRTYEAADLPDPLDSVGPRDLRSDTKPGDRTHRARATLTLNVRRAQAAPAAAVTPAAAPAAASVPPAPEPASTQKAEPAKPAQPSATDEAIDTVKKLRGLFGR